MSCETVDEKRWKNTMGRWIDFFPRQVYTSYYNSESFKTVNPNKI